MDNAPLQWLCHREEPSHQVGRWLTGTSQIQVQAETPHRIKLRLCGWFKQTDLQRLSTVCPDRIPQWGPTRLELDQGDQDEARVIGRNLVLSEIARPAREAASSRVRHPVSTETANVNPGPVEAILGSSDIEQVMT